MKLRKLEQFVQKAKKMLSQQIEEKYSEIKASSTTFSLFLHSLQSPNRSSYFPSKDFNFIRDFAFQDNSSSFEPSFLAAAIQFWFFRFCMLRFLDVSNFSSVKIVSQSFNPDKNLSAFSFRFLLAPPKSSRFFSFEDVGSFDAGSLNNESDLNNQSDLSNAQQFKYEFWQQLIKNYWNILPEPFQEAVQLNLDNNVLNANHSMMNRLLFFDNDRIVSQLLPDCFEQTPDFFRFVLPNDLESTKSFVRFINDFLTDEISQQSEILGWLYQFWQTEKKSQIMRTAVQKDDIPAATQLFTPRWIVKFLLQNSLGEFWLKGQPSSNLRQQMTFLASNSTHSPQTLSTKEISNVSSQTEKSVNRRLLGDFRVFSGNEECLFDCSLLDPACGCGHILIEAYGLLRKIYRELEKPFYEIPKLILTQHLFGLDIDEKAVRLTRFALYLEALKDNPNFGFQKNEFGQVASLLEHFVAFFDLDNSILAKLSTVEADNIQIPWESFQNMKTLGSLIRIPSHLTEIQNKLTRFETKILQKSLDSNSLQKTSSQASNNSNPEELKIAPPSFSQTELLSIQKLIKILKILWRKYEIIVCNPPYMGRKGMNASLKQMANDHYPDSKSDLYSMFIERSFDWAKSDGLIAMITMQSWLFLPSFKKLRTLILNEKTLLNLAHLGSRAFESINGEVVSVAAFILQNRKQKNQPSVFFRLVEYPKKKKEIALQNQWNRFELNNLDFFRRLPYFSFLYWIDQKMIQQLSSRFKIGDFANIKQGLATSNNERFIRRWFEVDYCSIGFRCDSQDQAISSNKQWFPYNKGGEQRKWFGNQDFVVNWKNNGQEIKECRPRSFVRNESYYFKESISWSKVSNALPTLRYYPAGHLFDVAGCSIFCSSSDELLLLLAYCNSSFFQNIMSVVSSTINLEIGQMALLPLTTSLIDFDDNNKGGKLKINSQTAPLLKNVKRLIQIAQTDWNWNELSWDFQTNPLCEKTIQKKTLSATFDVWRQKTQQMIQEMRILEDENNRFFRQNEESSKEQSVPLSKIGLFCNPFFRFPEQIDSNSSCQNSDHLIKKRNHLFQTETIKDFISFGIGCLLNRYSLTQPGMITTNFSDYINGPDNSCNPNNFYSSDIPDNNNLCRIQDHTQFAPQNNILTILDSNPFSNDIIKQFHYFLAIAFGLNSLDENIAFIEQTLGKNLSSYFREDFFPNHLAKFKKRPLYWLFSSPQGSFRAIAYYHQIKDNFPEILLQHYLLPYQNYLNKNPNKILFSKLSKQPFLKEFNSVSKKSNLSTINKINEELELYAQKLKAFIASPVSINKNDGIKINYLKYQSILQPVRHL
ncbi:MAG: BREX-1 system adenine-specific DNA-methyltransferase PglX [Planctomycetia bacterium]|nr:BREX-1 system adenine-specific DNA-methyltransferase PglX [Planctomycetia bacterium]